MPVRERAHRLDVVPDVLVEALDVLVLVLLALGVASPSRPATADENSTAVSTGAVEPLASRSASMNESYPPPFSMTRSACLTASWSCALGSNECGSWFVDDTIEVTSTMSPPISSAICAVDAGRGDDRDAPVVFAGDSGARAPRKRESGCRSQRERGRRRRRRES